MASILRVNTLTDASSNNSTAMSVINQGTIKYWINFTSVSSTSARDSTNHASLTDNGTAELTSTFSVTMGNTTYAPTAMMNDGNYGGVQQCEYSATNTTTAMRTRTCNNWHDGSATSDTNGIYFHIAGDLA